MKIPRNLFEIACRNCKKSGVRNAAKKNLKFLLAAFVLSCWLTFLNIFALYAGHIQTIHPARLPSVSTDLFAGFGRRNAKMEAGNSVTCKGRGVRSWGSTGRSRGSLEVIILTRYPVSTSVGNAWEVKTSLSIRNDHKCWRFIAELALREFYSCYWIFLTLASWIIQCFYRGNFTLIYQLKFYKLY